MGAGPQFRCARLWLRGCVWAGPPPPRIEMEIESGSAEEEGEARRADKKPPPLWRGLLGGEVPPADFLKLHVLSVTTDDTSKDGTAAPSALCSRGHSTRPQGPFPGRLRLIKSGCPCSRSHCCASICRGNVRRSSGGPPRSMRFPRQPRAAEAASPPLHQLH